MLHGLRRPPRRGRRANRPALPRAPPDPRGSFPQRPLLVGPGDPHRRREALFAATKAMGLEGVVTKRLDSRYQPGVRSRAWTKTKHFQKRTFALLGWVPPWEWRGDRGCVVLGLRSPTGIAVSGVVESGYDRDLVEQLPHLTRSEFRALQEAGHVWTRDAPLVGEVKFLEWSAAFATPHSCRSSRRPPSSAPFAPATRVKGL